MGSPVRLVVPLVGFAVMSLVTSLAVAQVPGSTGAPPPPGGGVTPGTAPAPTGSGSAAPDKFTTGGGDVGGFTFHDKPPQGGQGARAPAPARVVHRGGPLATFPGFEQLGDGGSRLFVQLSQNVPVQERRAQGSITYVLKGAHLRVHNDSNALVTVHFNTPVYRARLTPSGNDLLFVLEMRSAASPTFKVSDNPDHTSTLSIDFAKGDFGGNPDSAAMAPEESPTGRPMGQGTGQSAGQSTTQTSTGRHGGHRGASTGAPATNTGPTP